jgi:hypothetical protein
LIINQGCRPKEIVAARELDLDVPSASLMIPGGKSKAARRTISPSETRSHKISAQRRNPNGCALREALDCPADSRQLSVRGRTETG